LSDLKRRFYYHSAAVAQQQTLSHAPVTTDGFERSPNDPIFNF